MVSSVATSECLRSVCTYSHRVRKYAPGKRCVVEEGSCTNGRPVVIQETASAAETAKKKATGSVNGKRNQCEFQLMVSKNAPMKAHYFCFGMYQSSLNTSCSNLHVPSDLAISNCMTCAVTDRNNCAMVFFVTPLPLCPLVGLSCSHS